MNLYRRLAVYIRPYWKRLLLATLFSAIVSGMTALYAYLVKRVLDEVLIDKNFAVLYVLPFLIVGVTLVKVISSYYQSYLMRSVGARVIKDIRDALYAHVVRLPVRFFSETSIGIIISRISNDVMNVQSVVSTTIKNMFQQVLTMIGLLVFMFYQNWKMTVIAVFVLPVGYIPLVRFSRRLRRISQVGLERIADVTKTLHETLSGIRVVKAFGWEEKETTHFKERTYLHMKNVLRGTRVAEMTSPMMELLGAIGVAFIIWYGGGQVIRGEITAGALFAFITASALLYPPAKSLSTVNNEIQQAMAGCQRIFEFFDLPTEQALDRGTRSLDGVNDAVVYEHVSFQYEDTSVPALDGIDLKIKAGSVVAFVGSSGGGKSTLVNLLPRFYEPTEGRIRIDGTDILDIRLDALRSKIGMVSQEVVLFDDTVRNNIAYGRENVSDAEVREAAEAAYAHLFIERLPEKYEAIIGEKGVKLSGGERQRLAIARAILRNPPILILDEATSSLDSESEYMVQRALNNLMKNRTTLVIAHRLSTVQKADQIVVLSQGRISEIGRHEELIARDGPYRRLYARQFEEETDCGSPIG